VKHLVVGALHNQLVALQLALAWSLAVPISQNLVCLIVLQVWVAWHQMAVQWLDLFV
jgi:hypothetical protein